MVENLDGIQRDVTREKRQVVAAKVRSPLPSAAIAVSALQTAEAGGSAYCALAIITVEG